MIADNPETHAAAAHHSPPPPTMRFSTLLSALALVAVLIASGEALKCYTCVDNVAGVAPCNRPDTVVCDAKRNEIYCAWGYIKGQGLVPNSDAIIVFNGSDNTLFW